jgi:hypothetical protein
MPVEQYGFGSGTLWGLRTDISNPTPARFGTIQDVNIGMSFTVKELLGQYQAPVASARAGMKITGKAKAAKLNARAFNDIFVGQTLATGELVTVLDENGPVGITPTSNTITATNSGTAVDDLGLINAGTGVQYSRVASAPAALQYSFAAGVWTLNASEASNKFINSYTYTETTTGGRITAVNQLMGAAPIFKLVLGESFQSKGLTLVLYQCIATKLTLDFKNEDFVIPEFDFSAFANSIGQFFDWSADTV